MDQLPVELQAREQTPMVQLEHSLNPTSIVRMLLFLE